MSETKFSLKDSLAAISKEKGISVEELTEKVNLEKQSLLDLGLSDKAKALGIKEDVCLAKLNSGEIPFYEFGTLKLTLDQTAFNAVVGGLTNTASGTSEIEATFYLINQGSKKETKDGKPFKSMYIIASIGNNVNFMPMGTRVENGFAFIQGTLWSSQVFKPGFYKGKIAKKGKFFSINEVAPTKEGFDLKVAMEVSPFANFIITSRFPVEEVQKKDGGSFEKQNMHILVEWTSGKTEMIYASTYNKDWFGVKDDAGVVYQGTIEKKGNFYNLTSPPMKSDKSISLDNLDAEIIADFSDMSRVLGKTALLTPCFGNSEVTLNELENGGTMAFLSVTDINRTPLKVVCFDSKVLDNVLTEDGKLIPVVRILGKVALYKESNEINVYPIRVEKAESFTAKASGAAPEANSGTSEGKPKLENSTESDTW